MISVDLRTLFNSSQSLGQIANLPLKGKAAFRIAKVVGLVNIELEALDTARENLIGQYVENREANPIKYVSKTKAEKKESQEALTKEMEELFDTEVEINTERVRQEILENVEGVRPIWLSTLDWLFEE